MDRKLIAKLDAILQGEVKSPAIYHLLEEYYENVVWKLDEATDFDALYDEDVPYPEEFFLEVKNRPCGIYDAVMALLHEGYDINECADQSSALVPAVGAADARMVKFLIDCGADAGRYPNESGIAPESEQNWYLDELDDQYSTITMEEWDPEYKADQKKAILQTLLVLVRDGGLRSYGGLCIMVDESGHGSIGPARPLF